MFRNQSVNVHQFSMVPRSDIPRSSFRIQSAHKTTIDSGYLYPIYVDEVLPGDTFNLKMTAFGRLSTPIVPIMDNLYLDSFFFFVPNRIIWANWKKFMGEQDNPGDSISYSVPQVACPTSGWPVGSLADYFGIPTVGQIGAGNSFFVNSLPFRAYNLIWHEWFRDQNLQTAAYRPTDDGPDAQANFVLRRRGKRHDYFTSALPWTQKGNPVTVGLSGNALVKTSATAGVTGASNGLMFSVAATGAAPPANTLSLSGGNGTLATTGTAGTGLNPGLYPNNLFADLTTATAFTVNTVRQSFQIQKLLERDARGGTRYTEIVRAHFGVISPDARLQRPEYLGGGSTPISINPVVQTSGTGASGTSTPLGQLSAFGTTVAANHGFTQSFTEHGYIIGLVSVRADLNYQQGIRKLWSRSTRYDFYFPVFAMLGEQAILNKEIYATGSGVNDNAVFGYQERWAEYRYNPSLITGLMRSTAAGTLDVWHLAQKFTALPTLNSTFIEETPPVSRILATASTGKEFLLDCFFDIRAARPLPMYSVPGLIDHF